MMYPIIIGIITSAIYGINGDMLVGTECWNERYCIGLYQSTNAIPMNQAMSNCERDNRILLKIENYEIQTHVNMLLVNHSLSQNKAWIGGRREGSETLKTIDGMELGIQDVDNLGNHDADCLAIKRQSQEISYFLDNCDEKHGNHFVICKTHFSEEETCSTTGTDFHWVNDVCYKTLYKVAGDERGNNMPDFDWFTAQNMCNDLENGALVDDLTSSTLKELLLASGDVAWIGYMRNLWYWNKPSDIMAYYNWKSTINEAKISGACATIGQDGMWDQLECGDTLSHYFCMNGTWGTEDTDMSTQSTTTQQLTTTPTAQNTTDTDLTTTDMSSYQPISTKSMTFSTIEPLKTESKSGLTMYAGAAAGGAVIVILIVVVVCVVRKKKSERGEMESKATDADSTNMTIPSSHEQQYEMIPDGLFTPPGPSDDSVTPYAEFRGDPRSAPPNNERCVYDDPVAPSYGTSIPDMYQNAGSVNRESRDPEAKTGFDPVVSNIPPPAGANIYSIVNKPKDNDAGDMEDVVVDNTMYGKY